MFAVLITFNDKINDTQMKYNNLLIRDLNKIQLTGSQEVEGSNPFFSTRKTAHSNDKSYDKSHNSFTMRQKLIETALLNLLRRGTLTIEQQNEVCKMIKEAEFGFAIGLTENEAI